MENLLQIFDNEEYGQVRFLTIDNKVYAVASDITRVLGYNRSRAAVQQHCKGAIKHGIPTKGGTQQTNVIPAGDIIRLAAACKLDGADKFESWIFDTVMPEVLTEGKYDSIEGQIKKLEDEKEKELSLGLYALQKALKANPNDTTLTLLTNQKAMELDHYVDSRNLHSEIADVKDEVAAISDLIVLNPKAEWRKITNNIITAIGKKTGDYEETRDEIYIELTERAHCNLQTRLKNLKSRLRAQGFSESQVNNINKLDVIDQDDVLKQIYIQIVKEIGLKNGIKSNY